MCFVLVGSVMTLCIEHRASPVSNEPLGEKTVILRFEMPLSETITGFFDKLKEATSGYASFEYEQTGYRTTDLVKVLLRLSFGFLSLWDRLTFC